MNAPEITTLVNMIGLSIQVAAAFLIALLFLLLRRQAERKRYFLTWGYAWIVLALALAALLPTIAAGGNVPLVGEAGRPLHIAVSTLTYQVGKLIFLVLLLVGTLLYTHGGPWHRALLAGCALAVPTAAATVLTSHDVNRPLMWQAMAVVPVMAVCSSLMLRIARARRTLGSRLTGVIFALKSVTWVGTGIYSWRLGWQAGEPVASWMMVFANYGAYADLLLDVVLSFGMVLLLMEETVREVVSAHQELTVSHSHLERESFVDALTGALNRKAFHHGYGMQAARATFGSVAMFDLDNLKEVNDVHGHATGDLLLQHFSESIRPHLRSSDKLFRWGGDEFLAVLPRALTADARARLAEALRRIAPLALPGEMDIPVSASLGVAHYGSAEDLATAVELADRHMYDAKRERKARGET